jgi:hypothetical protein
VIEQIWRSTHLSCKLLTLRTVKEFIVYLSCDHARTLFAVWLCESRHKSLALGDMDDFTSTFIDLCIPIRIHLCRSANLEQQQEQVVLDTVTP